MRKIVNTHKIEYFESNIFNTYFKDQRLVVFDIESMGLNPRINEVVLAAFMEVSKDGTATVTQYLLDSIEEEPLLLSIIRDTLNSYDLMLTYNGKHFDIPFIKTRFQALGMRDMMIDEYNIDPYNLDLYLVLHGHSELKRILPNLKQKTIEEYMGLSSSRDDEISGAESVELFKAYLCSMDMEQREFLAQKILLHNHDDVMQLYKLLPIIKKTNFHQAMSKLGFPVFTSDDIRVEISNIKLSKNEITIRGTHNRYDFNYISFYSERHPFSCKVSKNGSIDFTIPVNTIENAQTVNLREFDINENLFTQLGGYINGFLILSQNNKVGSLEINQLAKELVKQVFI